MPSAENIIVRVVATMTEGNASGYRICYASDMQPGDVLYESDDYTPPDLSGNVGNAAPLLVASDGESNVDFAERVTRNYARLFAALSDDERSQLTARLADLTAEQEPPPAKETKAQKAARLAAEAAANAPPPPPEQAPEPIAEAPAPAPEAVLPPPAAEPPAASGWGNAPVVS